MIFIAIEIAIDVAMRRWRKQIGINSVFRQFAAAIQPLNHLTTPLFYLPAFPPLGAGFAGLS
jgi:hypothetical protein